MQFGGQLNAGRTGTNNGHFQLAGLQGLRLCLCAHQGIVQTTVKAFCLILGVQGDGKLTGTFDAKIVGGAAHRYD